MEVTVVPWCTVVAMMTCLGWPVLSATTTTKQCNEGVCCSPNVRSVIFHQTDMERECWSREEIALLFTRRMMQELLPKRRPTGVSFLLDYFKKCLETVRQMATSKRTHTLVITAMADALGGYLQGFGLPMAHQAYYEGTLGYDGAEQLHQLQDAFKKFLRTDGGGWTRPTTVTKTSQVQPIRLGKAPAGCDPCDSLVLKNELCRSNKEEGVEILMPYLDDPYSPTALAMPFKDKSLYSLTSRSSCNILVKYYSRALWCLTQSYGTSAISDDGSSQVPQVQIFLTEFAHWLSTDILKRLNDSTLYPAFGSVFRIAETLGKTKLSKPCKLDRITIKQADNESDCKDTSTATSRTFYILVILSLVISFWIIVLVVYMTYKWFITKKQAQHDSTTESDFISSEDESIRCRHQRKIEICTDKEDTTYDHQPTSGAETCSDTTEQPNGSCCSSSASSETGKRSKKKKKKRKKKDERELKKNKK